jgi:transcriptional antiterminator RfaH
MKARPFDPKPPSRTDDRVMLTLSSFSIAADEAPQPDARLPVSDHGRWYAVQCQPHRERGAAAHLANQDYHVFLPYREKNRRHARKIETVRVPYFPGYLFVRLDLTRDRWRSVNGTFGVVRLAMQGERPAPAPRGVVEALMEACGEDNLMSLQAGLTAGQPVRVLIGPFADLVGELEQLTDADRVRVLLDILGARTPVFFPRTYVVPAESCL